MADPQAYDDNSIDELVGPEKVRFRPNVMLGSSDIEAVKHTIVEITGNSLDEISSGFGDRLEIGLNEDYSIRVRDNGRGVPLGWNEKLQKWNYVLIYATLYAGGKYQDDSQKVLKNFTEEDWSSFKFEDFSYLASVGMNGLGATATQYSSEWFHVKSYRDGKCSEMYYEVGYPVWDELKVTDTDEPNGTEVIWKPDDTVFRNDTKVPEAWLRKHAENISIVANIEVTFTGQDGEIEVFPASSIHDYMTQKYGEAVTNRRTYRSKDGGGDILVSQADVVISPTGGANIVSRYYNNFVELKSAPEGAHDIGTYNAFTDFFKTHAKQNDVKLKNSDFEGILTASVSTRANKIDPRGQTKDIITDEYIANNIYSTTKKLLETEYVKGTVWVVESVDKVIEAAALRVEQEAARRLQREVTKKTSAKRTMPLKFMSCTNYDKKNYADVELWIAEGDSAGGHVAQARSGKNQSIYPVRGKSLNLFKANVEKLLGNKEVLDLIQILGAGVDVEDGNNDHSTFDMSKLRCSKIIIASDADSDGLHIRMLLTVLVWRLFPELIRRGMLYVAEAPLYGVKWSSGTKYYYSEEELAEALEGAGNVHVARYKGLGQMDVKELHESTVGPEKRKMYQVQFEPDAVDVYDVFDVLFGKSTDARKSEIMTSLMGEGDEDYVSIQSLLDDMDKYITDEADIEDVREIETVTL